MSAKGRLHLQKLISNNILESIPDSERTSGVQDVELHYDELNCITLWIRVAMVPTVSKLSKAPRHSHVKRVKRREKTQ